MDDAKTIEDDAIDLLAHHSRNGETYMTWCTLAEAMNATWPQTEILAARAAIYPLCAPPRKRRRSAEHVAERVEYVRALFRENPKITNCDVMIALERDGLGRIGTNALAAIRKEAKHGPKRTCLCARLDLHNLSPDNLTRLEAVAASLLKHQETAK